MDHPPPPSSPHSQPPSPRANPNPHLTRSAAAAARPPQRRYPKPPSFITRIVHFCFRPESWAEAARYPSHITFVPLAIVILLASLVATTFQAIRQYQHLIDFQQAYDKTYPAMELSSDGILTAKGELKNPVHLPLFGGNVLIDPTGKTDPQTLNWTQTFQLKPTDATTVAFVSNKDLYTPAGPVDEYGYQPLIRQPLAAVFSRGLGSLPLDILPPQGQTLTINGAALHSIILGHVWVLIVFGFFWAIILAIGDALWALMIMVLLSPLVMVIAGARREAEDGTRSKFIVLPRRAAVRMVAALTVPIILASAALRAAGYATTYSLGVFASAILWLVIASALAVWTAILARRIFGSLRPAK